MVNRQFMQVLQPKGNGAATGLNLHCSNRSIEQTFHVAVVCSRLGRSAPLHRQVAKSLASSAMRCRERGDRWLVATGSAISPWISRASELYGVPITWLAINEPADITVEVDEVVVRDHGIHRDSAVISLANRVEAVYVRRGGTIEASLKQRLLREGGFNTHVSVTQDRHCAGKSLIQLGAIGCYRRANDSHVQRSLQQRSIAEEDWTRTKGEWLVHCTRACPQNWPDETPEQYRDAILLGESGSFDRGPLESLCRILRSGRLVASAVTSNRQQPVVCFSAQPLQELLARRCFRSHLGRWDYEPFGIAIRLKAAQQIGIRSVVYGDPRQRKELPKDQQYRFHPTGKNVDWRAEKEWRSCCTVDLRQLDPMDVRVFAATEEYVLRRRVSDLPWRVTYGAHHAPETQGAATEQRKAEPFCSRNTD